MNVNCFLFSIDLKYVKSVVITVDRLPEAIFNEYYNHESMLFICDEKQNWI